MITGLYAAVLAVFLVGLMVRIQLLRFSHKVGLGDGGVLPLKQAVRAHGNFIEVVPFLLIVMMILENNGMDEWVLHSFGLLLLLSRGLHAWGLYSSAGLTIGRAGGTGLAQLLMLAGAGLLVWQYFIL